MRRRRSLWKPVCKWSKVVCRTYCTVLSIQNALWKVVNASKRCWERWTGHINMLNPLKLATSEPERDVSHDFGIRVSLCILPTLTSLLMSAANCTGLVDEIDNISVPLRSWESSLSLFTWNGWTHTNLETVHSWSCFVDWSFTIRM